MLATTETAILARLAAALPGAVLLGTFNDVDLTDDSPSPIVCQVRLQRIDSGFSVRASSAQVDLLFSFSVFCDVHRSTPADRETAYTLLQQAGNALVGWAYSPGQTPNIVDGPQTGYDGRILQIGFAFTVAAFFNAT